MSQGQSLLAVLIDGDHTMINGQGVQRTPTNGMGDLGLLINSLGARLGPRQEATLLLGWETMRRLGLDPQRPDVARKGKRTDTNGLGQHPLLAGPRSAGWSASHLDDWTTFHIAEGPAIHVGMLPWIEQRIVKEGTRNHFPLYDPDRMRKSLQRMVSWHRFTGTAWRSTPGMTGIAMIRNGLYVQASKHTTPGDRLDPTWAPPNFVNVAPANALVEIDYRRDQWSRPPEDGETSEVVGLDLNKAYLASAQSCLLARHSLRRTGRIAFDTKLSGYWSIKLTTWNDSRLPRPGGYRRTDGAGCEWVTSPTLALLSELAAEGKCDHPEIVDSYTAPGVQLLRPWAELIREGLAASADDPRLAAAFKMVYSETVGMFNSKRSRIKRPDWHHSIIAYARAGLWRKMRRAGDRGLYPRWIETDCLVYPRFDVEESEKYGLVLGGSLGQFKVKDVTL